MAAGRVFLTQVNVPNVGVNRSPKAYLLNPAAERAQFSSDMDQQLVQLRFETTAGVVRGAFNWMASEYFLRFLASHLSTNFISRSSRRVNEQREPLDLI